MVVIRLARGGSHKRPFYHVVATDSRNRRDGRFIERLGYFNPIARGNDVRLNFALERVDHWRSNGAQVSPRVTQLLKDFAGQATAKA
jgi:small subunit ribosomal protein S16